MLAIIIKNNFKLMLRSRAMLLMIPLGSLLVIAVLSNAFHTLLDEAEQAGKFNLGYQIQEESIFAAYEDVLLTEMEKQGIRCVSYSNADAEELVESGRVDVFLDMGKEACHIYANRRYEVQGLMIQYVMKQLENQGSNLFQTERVEVAVEELPAMKPVSARDYYGIIEVVYFITLCAILLVPVVLSERRGNLEAKLKMGNAGNITMYFGKLIPCIVMSVLLQVLITGSMATLIYDIQWGKPLVAFGVLCLLSVASSALGLLFILFSKNIAVSIVLLFTVDWWAGFLGGTYETYMYSTLPERVKEISPLYYVNRTLVEYSVGGSSDYLFSCILFLLGIIVWSILLSILLMSLRREKE